MLTVTRGQKFLIISYVSVMAMSAGIAFLIMSQLHGEYARAPKPAWFSAWVFAAGMISGGAGLYVSRGWMGVRGALGFARCLVGGVVMATLASIVGGTLIEPFAGAVYGPVVVATEAIAYPVLIMLWFLVTIVAHFCLGFWTFERENAWGDPSVSQLSNLSRANFYGNKPFR